MAIGVRVGMQRRLRACRGQVPRRRGSSSLNREVGGGSVEEGDLVFLGLVRDRRQSQGGGDVAGGCCAPVDVVDDAERVSFDGIRETGKPAGLGRTFSYEILLPGCAACKCKCGGQRFLRFQGIRSGDASWWQ